MKDCGEIGTCICEGIDPGCAFADQPNEETIEAIEAARNGELIAVLSPGDLFEDVFDELAPLHKVLDEVKQERYNQDKKWGAQNYPPPLWLMILGEEVGEANKAALEAHFVETYKAYPPYDISIRHYRKELIQVAAVAIAAAESLDRNELAAVPPAPELTPEKKYVPCEKCCDGIIGHECGDHCICQEGHMDCWECDGNGRIEVKQ